MSVSVRKGRLVSRRLRIARLERLEDREVLSADGGFGNLAAMGPAIAAEISQLTAPQTFDLSITGTQCSYSPLGLPAEMKGNLFTSGGTSSIGTYDETLTPILMQLSPEAPPQFVGTMGTATFDFNLSFGSATPITIGSITTHDTSFIQGVGASGQIMVGSTGTIVGSTGICTGLTGGFASHSVVVMGAGFNLQTSVHFTVQDSMGVNMNSTLSGLATIDGFTSGNTQQGWAGNAWTASGDSGHASHDGDHAAVDHVFSSLDSLWGDEARG